MKITTLMIALVLSVLALTSSCQVCYAQDKTGTMGSPNETGVAILHPEQLSVKKPSKADPIQLNEVDSARWKKLAEIEDAAQKQLQKALDEALTCKLDSSSALSAVATLQQANSNLQLMQSARRELLSDLRLRLTCADCIVSPDGKLLVKPGPPAPDQK
jgi:hypothetical protein